HSDKNSSGELMTSFLRSMNSSDLWPILAFRDASDAIPVSLSTLGSKARNSALNSAIFLLRAVLSGSRLAMGASSIFWATEQDFSGQIRLAKRHAPARRMCLTAWGCKP